MGLEEDAASEAVNEAVASAIEMTWFNQYQLHDMVTACWAEHLDDNGKSNEETIEATWLTDPSRCPACKVDRKFNVFRELMVCSDPPETVTVTFKCLQCKADWDSIYVLAGVDRVAQPGHPVQVQEETAE